ncbi:MAG: type II secretion system protein GspL [Venatoribacter sp.]
METLKIQWHALLGQWLVEQSEGLISLAQWADEQPDLIKVRFILSAQNYSVHWVNLPGVSSRHLSKALPFALEERLIEDLSRYLIIPASSQHKTHRAYVLAEDLLDRLLQACDLHHIQVQEVIPETWLLGMQKLFMRDANGWLISLPGDFEGYVTDQALTPVLESIFSDNSHFDEIKLTGPSLDELKLLKTTLETSFPEQITELQLEVASHDEIAIAAKPLNLLVGRFTPQVQREKKPTAWWRPLLTVAAAALIIWTVSLYSQVQSLKSQAAQVQAQATALYKGLFPNERIRSLERQFREKLATGGSTEQVGFVASTYALAKVYREQNLADKITLVSLRYNDRLNELTVELKASSLQELQTLRQTLIKNGVQADIASATNDKDGVKGRLRIGGQA